MARAATPGSCARPPTTPSNAAAWTRRRGRTPDAFGAALDRWTGYYREQAGSRRSPTASSPRRRTAATGRGRDPAAAAARAGVRPPAARMFAACRRGHRQEDAVLGLATRSRGRNALRAGRRAERGLERRPLGAAARGGASASGADVDEPTLRLLRALDGRATAREAVSASLGEDALPRAAAPARHARDGLPRRRPTRAAAPPPALPVGLPQPPSAVRAWGVPRFPGGTRARGAMPPASRFRAADHSFGGRDVTGTRR